MTDDQLADVTAANQQGLDRLADLGVKVDGLDLQRLIVMVDVLLTPSQHRVFEERWQAKLSAILAEIESQLPKAALLADAGLPLDAPARRLHGSWHR